jgi:hypothetical protein
MFMFAAESLPAAIWRRTALAVVLLFLGASGCGNPVINSIWAEPGPVIDGNLDDWGGALRFFEEPQVELGVRNDGRYLYLGLHSTNSVLLLRAMIQGLEIWVDPQGGEARTFGIRYPLGVREMDFDIGHEGRLFDLRELARKYEAGPNELRVFTGPGASHLAKPGEGGIQVAMSRPEHDLFCEVRLPLSAREGEPHAIGARPGALLGVGFVIPRPERGSPQGGFGGPPEGSPGGGVGMAPPGEEGEGDRSDGDDPDRGPSGSAPGSGDGPSGRGERAKRTPMRIRPLDFWLKVRLAEGPATAVNP